MSGQDKSGQINLESSQDRSSKKGHIRTSQVNFLGRTTNVLNLRVFILGNFFVYLDS